MPIDPRKRQKSLQKKASRRKEKKHLMVREESTSLAARFSLASECPVVDSWISDSCWDEGIGWALLSRQLPDGQVAFAIFLVDNYCLGVKNVIVAVLSRASYDVRSRTEFRVKGSNRDYTPASFRKFIEGAVQYARDLGLAPHKNYETAKLLFGDIDPNTSTESFEYGKDGKPFFVNGPNDSPARIREILATLARSQGAGNYDFMVGGPGTTLDGILED